MYGILTHNSDQKDDQFLLRASLSHYSHLVIFKTCVLAFFFSPESNGVASQSAGVVPDAVHYGVTLHGA